jgi:hypothetical protein
MVWGAVAKLNEIASFFGFKTKRPKQAVVRWVNKHKVVTLMVTEGINYGVHGISNPLSVDFALGGTIVNVLVVFFLMPIWAGLHRVVEGGAK